MITYTQVHMWTRIDTYKRTHTQIDTHNHPLTEMQSHTDKVINTFDDLLICLPTHRNTHKLVIMIYFIYHINQCIHIFAQHTILYQKTPLISHSMLVQILSSIYRALTVSRRLSLIHSNTFSYSLSLSLATGPLQPSPSPSLRCRLLSSLQLSRLTG